MSAERWLPIPSAPDYEASNLGNVRSVARTIHYSDGRVREYPSKVLSQSTYYLGYKRVNLRVDKSQSPRQVHALVLEAFVGPRPEGMIALHINGEHGDNRAENLRWGTHAENNADTITHGRNSNSNKTHCKWGHEYTPENTYIIPSTGSRVCRICNSRRTKEYKVRIALGVSGPHNRDKTQCPCGEELAGANLYTDRRGHRYCRACHRAKVARYQRSLQAGREVA